MEKTETVPIWQKINLTIDEAAEYSNIGINKIREMLKEKSCPFLLKIGNRQLVKRDVFERYLEDVHFI